MSKVSNGTDLNDDLNGDEDDESLPGAEDTIVLSEESLKDQELSLIHISEPTRHICLSRMPSSA